LLRIVCLLIFTTLCIPSFGQDVEDEYMIELAKDLYLGIPIKSTLTNSLSLLNESNNVNNVIASDDTINATFNSHPFLNINSLKGDDNLGSVNLQLLFKHDELFERRIIVNKQPDLKAFNNLYNLLKEVSFYIEKEKPIIGSTFYRENTLFTSIDGRALAHLELSYNQNLFNPEEDTFDIHKTVCIVLAIYDNTLY
jgi:hypothetical protein